jgi:hypothetical protein
MKAVHLENLTGLSEDEDVINNQVLLFVGLVVRRRATDRVFGMALGFQPKSLFVLSFTWVSIAPLMNRPLMEVLNLALFTQRADTSVAQVPQVLIPLSLIRRREETICETYRGRNTSYRSRM